MKLKFLAAAAIVLLVSQDPTDGRRWWARIEYLADDSLQGRDVGSEGFEKAAVYVAAQFEKIGLKPAGVDGYRQPVMFESRRLVAESASLTLARDGQEDALVLGQEASLSARSELDGAVEASMVFVGYGMSIPEAKWDDLGGVDLHGKIAVYVNMPAPADVPDNVKSHLASAGERWAVLKRAGAIGIATFPTLRAPAAPPASGAADAGRGAAAPPPGGGRGAAPAPAPIISLADPELQDQAGQSVSITVTARGAAKFLAGSGHTLDELTQLASANQPLPSFPLTGTLQAKAAVERTTIPSTNVIGMFEGSDPALKDEYVVMSAHLDHVGVGRAVNGDSIYNGAMDDASGVASVIEIARLLKESGVKPKRSVIFMTQTGEEKGLLGSRYFAARPTVPVQADRGRHQPGHVPAALSAQGDRGAGARRIVARRHRPRRGEGGRRRGADRSRARAEPFHPQRSIQLHPRRHSVAGLQVRLRVRIAGGEDPPRLGARHLPQAGGRPESAGRCRGGGEVQPRDHGAAEPRRECHLASGLERHQLLQTIREVG